MSDEKRLKWLRAELKRAQKASEKVAAARGALPPGSTRARVTTANARWMRKAEYRDRIAKELATLEQPINEADHG